MTGLVQARYSLEFKQEAVRLVRGGQTVSSVAKTLGLSDQTLRNWLKAEVAGECTLRDAASSEASGDCKTEADRLPRPLPDVLWSIQSVRIGRYGFPSLIDSFSLSVLTIE